MSYLLAEPTSVQSDPGILVAIIGLIGIILTALISYFAARQASKQADKANKRDAQVNEKSADVNSWDKLVVSLQNELGRLSGKVEQLEKQADDDRKRIGDLEDAVREGDVKYRVALQYIHDVIAWTKSLIKTETIPPEAPVLIAPDLEMH